MGAGMDEIVEAPLSCPGPVDGLDDGFDFRLVLLVEKIELLGFWNGVVELEEVVVELARGAIDLRAVLLEGRPGLLFFLEGIEIALNLVRKFVDPLLEPTEGKAPELVGHLGNLLLEAGNRLLAHYVMEGIALVAQFLIGVLEGNEFVGKDVR